MARTILVVEDDAALRGVVVRMLQSGGFKAISTGKAADGLAMIRAREGVLDLIILDMMMPGMSGLDLATDLHREYPGLQILYISGYIGSVAAQVIARNTPQFVLLKPFTQQTLLERVELLLGTVSRKEISRDSRDGLPGMRDGTSG